ncbi:hypothetical protein [Chitinophaga parva]|uniref:hypothetical protein n=1 Tax=Chitinophaga parva TaxID=2169414 RepID=UPI001402D7DB|nr:hypothetical protein [Chitinophaga parva]
MAKANVVKVWRTPLLLGILSGFGLLAALLGNGAWKAFGCTALIVPLFIICWKVLRRKS